MKNAMRYISTRGSRQENGRAVLLGGLAADGGLYLPERWPHFDASALERLSGLPYWEVVYEILNPFLTGIVASPDLRAITKESYQEFGHKAVVPIRQIGDGLFLQELFHGPTLAFKDLALQCLGRLFDYALAGTGERITVIGATSGDTGPAAMAGCAGRANVDCFILFPLGRTSAMQQRQMTCLSAHNVFAIGIEGSFDDCQSLVKMLFQDGEFCKRYALTAVNSINIVRILTQAAYYFAAALALGAASGRSVTFSVPTGNFGNVLSGYIARKMGLPVNHFLVATNTNDALAQFFQTGRFEVGRTQPTLSPSMDVQMASNFERLLYEMAGEDPVRLVALMQAMRENGCLPSGIGGEAAPVMKFFSGYSVSDEQTLAAMRQVFEDTHDIIDPHTAIAVEAAYRARSEGRVSGPIVALSTAHPAKFPDTVEKAIGRAPVMPAALTALMDCPQRLYPVPANAAALKNFIITHIR